MLKDSIAVLAATEPPNFGDRMRAVMDINAKCSALETALGLPRKVQSLNPARAKARLTELEQLAALRSPAKPAAVAQVAATVPSADDGILKATLAEFHKMDAATRTQFARDGGHLKKSDFDRLPIHGRSQFCIAGGKILDDTPANPRHRSTAAASFTRP